MVSLFYANLNTAVLSSLLFPPPPLFSFYCGGCVVHVAFFPISSVCFFLLGFTAGRARRTGGVAFAGLWLWLWSLGPVRLLGEINPVN